MTLQTPADDAPHLAIGQLARRTGLTLKALRHYDRVGLLPPAHVDPATGHRYYAPAQLEVARLVHLLRSVDVPLDDVRTCVESGATPPRSPTCSPRTAAASRPARSGCAVTSTRSTTTSPTTPSPTP